MGCESSCGGFYLKSWRKEERLEKSENNCRRGVVNMGENVGYMWIKCVE